MGQAWSTEEVPQAPPRRVSIQSPQNVSNEIIKKNFSNLEIYSLNNTFEILSTVKDNKEVIEKDSFIQYLDFPDEIGIGPILYRSFTYLASYPSPAHEENSLTYDGLIKAVAIYCDKVHNVISEDRVKLIFESFATHEEHSSLGITPKAGISYLPKIDISDTNIEQKDETFDLNNLDLNSIEFDKIDFDTFFKDTGSPQKKEDEVYTVSKVPCTEIIEILTGIDWLMTRETIPILSSPGDNSTNTNIDQIREKIISVVVENMARYDADLRNLSHSQIFSPQTYITWPVFKSFIQRNIPKVFDIFKPFFYGQFLIGQTLSQNRQSMMIGPHVQLLPKLDKSECLQPDHLPLLSWMLPRKALNRKKWDFLYSGSKHGFSMNRFKTHVFKYNGPTLMLIKAMVTTNHDRLNTSPLNKKYSEKDTILIGAYITDQWRSTSSSRTCFGSAECCLFELYPTFELFPASNRNTSYVYYNPAVGIGFGGTATSGPTSGKIESMDANSFVIQLDNTLQYGRYRNDALRDGTATYSLSATRPFFDISFEVLEIEVTGIGGEGVMEKQKKSWKFEDEMANRSNHRGDRIDKEVLKMAGIIDENPRSFIRREP